MGTLSKFTTPGIALVLTLVFGVWLGLSGKPYNGILFNIHKLIALGAVIVAAVQIYTMVKSVEISALLIVIISVTGLCIVALFVSGALMSMGKPPYELLRIIHQVSPVVMAGAMALALYLLIGKKL